MIGLVERLPPTPSTLRRLYVHSGNQCAYPGCPRVLVNAKGQWVGEVCHIEAAMPGGERFNAAGSNEDRRQPENLMLMCHEHHVETNDVNEFPVERLKQIKADHESQFTGQPVPFEKDIEEVVNDIVASTITDLTERTVLHLPQTLAGYNSVLDIGLDSEYLEGSLEILVPTLEELRRLPVDARAVFAVVVDRSFLGEAELPLHELEQVTNLAPTEAYLHVTTLERYGIAHIEDDDWREDRPPTKIVKASAIEGWDFWPEFKQFCAKTRQPVRELINELRFNVLDDIPEQSV
jgi:hypothetical protein